MSPLHPMFPWNVDLVAVGHHNQHYHLHHLHHYIHHKYWDKYHNGGESWILGWDLSQLTCIWMDLPGILRLCCCTWGFFFRDLENYLQLPSWVCSHQWLLVEFTCLLFKLWPHLDRKKAPMLSSGQTTAIPTPPENAGRNFQIRFWGMIHFGLFTSYKY